MAQITSDMLVGQIVNEYPMLIDTLLEAGMHCLGCPAPRWSPWRMLVWFTD